MGHTTVVVRLPGDRGDGDSGDSGGTSSVSGIGDDATRASAPAGLLPTRITTRMRGIDHEHDLARALDSWRPIGGLGGEGSRFVLGGRLGQGSQGVVFALRDRDAQRTVALKTLNGREVDREDVARFLHEVQVTAQLEHPGVVPVHDVGVLPDGTVFYTMKRVEGVVLTDWLTGRAGSSAHRFEIIQLFLKICDTMAFAHSRGVVHRDLKPRNIMVGTYGEVLVMDWGLAKVVGAPEPQLRPGTDVQLSDLADHETLAGTAIGTPAYMSPEQARGDTDRVDQRSDIYGLGVMLYEMLAAASPYERGQMRRTVAQVVGGQWKPIDKQPACHDLPRRLGAIVHKAMAHTQEARYQQVSGLAADLRAFLAGEAVTAYRETFADLAARVIDRHRRTIAWATLGVLVVFAASGAAWLYQQRRDTRMVAVLREEAARAVALGSWVEARQANEKILAYRPDDREAYENATRLDVRIKGEAERQAREAEQVRKARQDQARAAQLHEQAVAAAARGGLEGLDEAQKLAKQAQVLHPDDALATEYEHWRDALAALRGQAEQSARNEAQERQRRESAAAFTVTAAEAERSGDLDAAIGALTSAVEIVPDPAKVERLGALVARRNELRASRDSELREQEQSAARAARRAEAETQLREADQHLAAGRPAQAQDCVERAAALVSDHPGLAGARTRVEIGLRAARERSAEAMLAEADRAGAAISVHRQTALARAEEMRRLRAELDEGGDPSRRAAMVAAEDAMLAAGRDAAAQIAVSIRLLNGALERAPGHPPVRAALAAFWLERLREAEADGDLASAAAAEAQARVHDDGALREVIDGLAWLENGGSSEIALVPIIRLPDRTERPSGAPLSLAAGARLRVLRGRYLASTADGVRLALTVERGRTHALAIPRLPSGIPEGCAFLPGGVLHDQTGHANGTVGGFIAMVREVTCGEWLEFINDRAVREEIARAAEAERGLILAPRRDPYATRAMWRRAGGFGRAGGAFALEDEKDGTRIDPARPVANISHDDGIAYAAWRARRDGRPWRLPTVAEWQFAVQGGDVRAHPWGSAADLMLCASALTLARDPALAEAPGCRHAADCSLHGLWDLAGGRSEFCTGPSTLGADLRPLLGGSLHDRQPERFAAWSRRDVDRRLVHPGWGVRLVYSP